MNDPKRTFRGGYGHAMTTQGHARVFRKTESRAMTKGFRRAARTRPNSSRGSLLIVRDVFVFDRVITFARPAFEFLAIKDGDSAAAIPNSTTFLQFLCQ